MCLFSGEAMCSPPGVTQPPQPPSAALPSGERLVRCAIYTRQSVARAGVVDVTSCQAQREACEAYIERHRAAGWQALPTRFDDEGVGAATLDRPALQRLLGALDAGRVQRVVVHRLDRLTRNFRDWVELTGLLRRRRVGLSVVQGDFASGDAASGLTLNVLALFAEYERELIGARLRDARAARKARGLRTAGRLPFGYASDARTKQLVAKAGEAEVVSALFERAAEGALPSALAVWANGGDGPRCRAKGSASRAPARRWSATSVLRLLRNPVYVGGGEGSPAAHPPLVSRSLFDQVAAALDRRRTRAPSPRMPWSDDGVDPFLLRGLLRCVACGRLMTTSAKRALRPLPARPPDCSRGVRWSANEPTAPSPRDARTARPDRVSRSYRCHGAKACRGTHVAAAAIEAAVVGALRDPRSVFVSEAQRERVARAMNTWDVLFWPLREAVLHELVWEVRWDGRRRRFSLLFNDVGDQLANGSRL